MASTPDQDDLSGRPLSEWARFHSPVLETASFVPLAPASDAKQVHIHRARHSINEMRSILSEIRSMRSDNSLSSSPEGGPSQDRSQDRSLDRSQEDRSQDSFYGSESNIEPSGHPSGSYNTSNAYTVPTSIPALSPSRYRSVSAGNGPSHPALSKDAFSLTQSPPQAGTMSKSTSGNTLTPSVVEESGRTSAETDDGHSDLFESASETPDKGLEVPPRRSSVNWSAGGGLQELYEAGLYDSTHSFDTPVPASTQFGAYQEAFVTPREYPSGYSKGYGSGEYTPQPPPHDRSFGHRSVSAPVPTDRFAPSKAEFDETLQECIVPESYSTDEGSSRGLHSPSPRLSHQNSVSSSVYHNSPTSIRRAERARQDSGSGSSMIGVAGIGSTVGQAAVPETVIEVSPEADSGPLESVPEATELSRSNYRRDSHAESRQLDQYESTIETPAKITTPAAATSTVTPPTGRVPGTPPTSAVHKSTEPMAKGTAAAAAAAAVAAATTRLEGSEDDAAAVDGPKRTPTLRTKRTSHHSRHGSVIDVVSDHRSSVPSELAFQTTPRNYEVFDGASVLQDSDYEVRRRSADILSGRYSATSLENLSSGELHRRNPPTVQTPQPPATPLSNRHSVHVAEHPRELHGHARSHSYDPRPLELPQQRHAEDPREPRQEPQQEPRQEPQHEPQQELQQGSQQESRKQLREQQQQDRREQLRPREQRREPTREQRDKRISRASSAAQQRMSHVSGTSTRRAFRKKSIESLLRKSEDFDLDNIDLPPAERHLLEKFVDAVSKLSVEIQLDEGKRVEGRRRLNNALRAIEGWF